MAEKAVLAKDKVAEAAVHTKDSVEDVFASGQKQAQHEADRARQQAEEKRQHHELEKQRKKKQKKFMGIF